MTVLADDELFGQASSGPISDEELFGEPPAVDKQLEIAQGSLEKMGRGLTDFNSREQESRVDSAVGFLSQLPGVETLPDEERIPLVADDLMPFFEKNEDGLWGFKSDWGLDLQFRRLPQERKEAAREALRILNAPMEADPLAYAHRQQMDQEGLNAVGRALRMGTQRVAGAVGSAWERYNNLDSEAADQITEGTEAMQRGVDKDLGWAGRMASGAASNLMSLAAAGPAGGMPAIMGVFGQDAFESARHNALRNGATVEEANKIGRASAGFEVGVMTAFNVLGLAGLERTFVGRAGWKGLKKFGVSILAELSEEEITSFGQLYSGAINPDDLSGERKWETFRDTAAQTLLMMGATGGSQAAINFIANPTHANARKAGIPPEVASTKKQLEELAESARVTPEGAVSQPVAPEAPSEPVDAIPPGATPESPVEPGSIPEATQEVVSEPEAPEEPVLTKYDRQTLRRMGFTKEQIEAMPYEEANRILEAGVQPAPPEGIEGQEVPETPTAEPAQTPPPLPQSTPPPIPEPVPDTTSDLAVAEIQSLVDRAMPKSKGVAKRSGKNGVVRVHFPGGYAVDVARSDKLEITDEAVAFNLKNYGISDTPENRQWFHDNINGMFQLRAQGGQPLKIGSLITIRNGLDDGQLRETFRHEALHFARQVKLIDDATWAKVTEALAKGKTDEDSQQEAVNFAVQADPTFFEKLKKVIDDILKLFGLPENEIRRLKELLRSGEVLASGATKPSAPGQGPLAKFRKGTPTPAAPGRAPSTPPPVDEQAPGAAGISRAAYDEKRPRWYSKAKQLILEKMGNKAAPSQVLNMLRKHGAKEEELEWSGLTELLGKPGGPQVTKDQVISAIDNGVQVEEIVHGAREVPIRIYRSTAHASPVGSFTVQASDDQTRRSVGGGIYFERIPSNGMYRTRDVQRAFTREEAIEYATEVIRNRRDNIRDDTKYGQYQEPGGENYRELLLTLPIPKGSISEDSLRDESGEQVLGPEDFDQPVAPVFRSSHFDEPNILAHIRFNERTDADGKKVLFIEEIQSDWHQRGRDFGYLNKNEEAVPPPMLKPAQREDGMWFIAQEDGTPYGTNIYQNGPQYVNAIIDGILRTYETNPEDGRVPNAPFKKTWPLLAMKRAIQWAAENGFERVAWTTGVQQSNRYPPQGANDVGAMRRHVGLTAFYDETLVNETNKFIKKFGAKVRPVEIGEEPERDEVVGEPMGETPAGWESAGGEEVHRFTAHGFDVTPEMRDSAVTYGQPMFAIPKKAVEKRLKEQRAYKAAIEAGKIPKTEKRKDDIEAVKSGDPDVERRILTSKFRKHRETALDKTKDFFSNLGTGFTRRYHRLSDKTFGAINDLLRRIEEIPVISKALATHALRGIVHDLKPNEYDLFTRVIIFRDLKKDVDNGLYSPETNEEGEEVGRELPFGLTPESLAADLEKYEKAAEASPQVTAAIAKRQELLHKLRDELVDRKLLPEKVKEFDDYFHHQVIQYLQGDRYTNQGLGHRRVAPQKKGWQRARTGSELDYNTDYLDAEFAVLSQGFQQIFIQDYLKRLRQLGDITPLLKQYYGEDWSKHVPEGYVKWQPTKGNVFYRALTVSDRALQRYLEGTEILTEEDFREIWAQGAKREEWVIPAELAATLDNFTPQDENWANAIMSAGVGRWKKYKLTAPWNALKYNINNMSSDVDRTFAYDPRILKDYARKAEQDMRAFHFLNGELTEEIADGIKHGVLGSGRVSEIDRDSPHLGDNNYFKKITGKGEGLPAAFWNAFPRGTAYREDILRLAAWRYFKDKLAKNPNYKMYGASKSNVIDQLTQAGEPTDVIAARLARDLMGDYGNISSTGQWLRQHMFYFYSWWEISLPFYLRLFKNVAKEGRGTGNVAKTAAKAAAAKTVAKSATATATAVTAAGMLYGLTNLYNHIFWPDEEEELSDDAQRELHLILGRRDDGTIMTLRVEGALSDVLSWADLQDVPTDVAELATGDATFQEKVGEAANAALNKLVGGFMAVPKGLTEAAMGTTIYPDVTNPRPVRDKVEHALRLVDADWLYRKIVGTPDRDDTFGELVWGLVAYSHSPGEGAYYAMRHMASQYAKEKGGDSRRFTPNDMDNALYYYKQAVKHGQDDLARQWMNQYMALGGTKKGRSQSARMSSPLGFISAEDQADFIMGLSAEERKLLERAEKWYDDTYHTPDPSPKVIEGEPPRKHLSDPMAFPIEEASWRRLRMVLLSQGNPKTDTAYESIEERTETFDKEYADAKAWLIEHKDHPVVGATIDAWLNSQKFQDTLGPVRRPRRQRGMSAEEWQGSLDNYQRRLDRRARAEKAAAELR